MNTGEKEMKMAGLKIMIGAAIVTEIIFSVSCANPASWPNHQVPYILIGFNQSEQATIIQSMYLWEKTTGVNFKNVIAEDYDEDTSVLHIFKSSEESDIKGLTTSCGYDEDKLQVMILGEITQKSSVHELGHVLGLGHEHQRPDRDYYIAIIWSHIIDDPSYMFQFAINSPRNYDYDNYDYDYTSCMHYSNNAGSIEDDLDTIESPIPVGIYDIPSKIDIQKVKDIQGTSSSLLNTTQGDVL